MVKACILIYIFCHDDIELAGIGGVRVLLLEHTPGGLACGAASGGNVCGLTQKKTQQKDKVTL